MKNSVSDDSVELTALCDSVRELIRLGKFPESEELIKKAMSKFPDAPQPHNLLGIQLENQGNHLAAAKHFRAAWALDPTYLPARFNLYQYSDIFETKRRDAYAEEDCR